MKKLLGISLILIAWNCHAQIAKDIMINAAADLIKSDNDGYFEKLQTGVELNYFISRKFTATGGAEFWTEHRQFSAVMGGRWYPIPEAFVRVRGIIGANRLSIGGGWVKPLNNNFKFEALADVYTHGDIAIRAGIAYLIRR